MEKSYECCKPNFRGDYHHIIIKIKIYDESKISFFN